MKKRIVFLLLVVGLSGSIVFAQNSVDGRAFSGSPNVSMVNNKPKVHIPETVIETGENASKQVVAENLFVAGKLGIGFDMTDGTTVPFTTMILKENNIRILFDDSSSTGTFPSNDWAITINSVSDGGDSYYAIEDVTASATPFKIMAGAADSSFVMGSTGRVGLGTATPLKDVHLNKGDTPTLRLEQNNNLGWSAQIWDIAGNEANFFIRDVTNSSSLSFRIQAGTPTNTLTLKSTGYVGIGTWDPEVKLHVAGNIKSDSTLVLNPLTEAPASDEGKVYMDGNDHLLKYFNGTEWLSFDDSQDLLDATLTGTVLQIDIENGTSVSVDLQPLIADLEARVTALEEIVTGKGTVKYSSTRLFQNAPNPFMNQTTIGFYIPETVQNAKLQITGIQGDIVKEIIIYNRGEGSLVIDTNDIENGTFFYSLIIDGQKLDTKTLIKID